MIHEASVLAMAMGISYHDPRGRTLKGAMTLLDERDPCLDEAEAEKGRTKTMVKMASKKCAIKGARTRSQEIFSDVVSLDWMLVQPFDGSFSLLGGVDMLWAQRRGCS